MGYIYKIINGINNKIYIGQTRKTINKRWQQHICNSTKDYFSQVVLYKAFAKYGIEHFTIKSIEEVDDELLDEKERYWIDYFNTYYHGYNSTLGGKAIALYDFDEQQVIRDFHELKTARKVAEKYGVDHNTVDGILNKHQVERYSQRIYHGQKVIAEKDGIRLRFGSIVECAEYLIANNHTKSKQVRTVKQYISDTINNRKQGDYYGWVFSKE